MSKDKLTDYDATASNNTDVGGISVAEGMLPSGVNNAIREQMSHLKDFASGTTGIDVLSLADDDASHAIKLQAPSAVTADTTFTLPDGDGTADQVLKTDGSGQLGWADRHANPSLIVNGAMAVNQRGNVTGKTASTYGGPDRFYSIISSLGTWSISQDTDAPSGSGFSSSYKLACTTADASPAAADHLGLHYRIEGQDLQQLSKGTSSAKSVTLSFWVKCNKTGNFQVSFYDSDNTRHIASTVIISSAATWQYVQITFAGDTTGAFNNDNGASAFIEIFFDAGTDWTSGSVPTTWQSVTQANRAAGTNLALGNSTSNYINITGVKLELGSTATPFEHRSFGDELARCQRYYYKIGGSVVYQRYFMASCQGSNFANGTVFFPVKMRSQPSLEHTGTAANYGIYTGDAIATCTAVPAISTTASDENVANVSMNSTSGLVSGRAAEIISNNNANAYLAFSAEL